jgi:hypothetical protein
MIKKALTYVPQADTDSEKPPRVYFNDFNDWLLNIYNELLAHASWTSGSSRKLTSESIWRL